MIKNDKKKEQKIDKIEDVFEGEYVGADVLELLWGYKRERIYQKSNYDITDRVSSIQWGHGRRYNFYEAAKIAYPTLSDFEIALLRIDVQDRLLKKRNKNVIMA